MRVGSPRASVGTSSSLGCAALRRRAPTRCPATEWLRLPCAHPFDQWPSGRRSSGLKGTPGEAATRPETASRPAEGFGQTQGQATALDERSLTSVTGRRPAQTGAPASRPQRPSGPRGFPQASGYGTEFQRSPWTAPNTQTGKRRDTNHRAIVTTDTPLDVVSWPFPWEWHSFGRRHRSGRRKPRSFGDGGTAGRWQAGNVGNHFAHQLAGGTGFGSV